MHEVLVGPHAGCKIGGLSFCETEVTLKARGWCGDARAVAAAAAVYWSLIWSEPPAVSAGRCFVLPLTLPC
jgi:hypothetical protein